MEKVGIVYSDRYMDHDTGGHVENPARVRAIRESLLEAPWADKLEWISPRAAFFDEISMIHDPGYIEAIRNVCGRVRGISNINPDTAVCPKSYEVALLAAGGVIEGIDRVLDGRNTSFFAVVRPPGHHAESDESLGFCLFNNIAIGARYAIENKELSRVFILDWDVHHGNGTQHSFEADPTVFFCSFHQYPHYPGTGGKSDFGYGEGTGYTLNLPMSSGSSDRDYLYLMKEIVVPAIRKYNPELLLVSAGFDAHRRDPLSGIMLSEDCYGAMMGMLLDALDGRCRAGLVLEGGYNLNSLGLSAASAVSVLAGEETPAPQDMEPAPGVNTLKLAEFLKSEHPFLGK